MAWGVLLSVALLVAVYAGFLMLVQTFAPETLDIPLVGPVGGLRTLLSWGSALFMIGLSIFLMVPVAAGFSALFLEDVAQAVEAVHYPHLPPVPRARFADTAVATVNFVALVIGVNLGALVLAPFAGPFIVPLFWAVNGLLLTVPLTIPFLNLVIPVVGAATFTHLFHRVMAREG